MNIAIIGWGSLIWDPKELRLEEDYKWRNNGPFLPIEFSRISLNKRLTLVITESAELKQTLFTKSNLANLADAVENLRLREGTKKELIGCYSRRENYFSDDAFKYKSEITSWINETDFDAVIWTNIPENWEQKTKDRIAYLNTLTGNELASAKEYIIKAPTQINTILRKEIEEKLNWKN